MGRTERRNQVFHHIVNEGIALDSTRGSVAAWIYMCEQGVDEKIVLRVLIDPKARRSAPDPA